MSGFSELGGRLLVLFDGHCVLCNRTVRWFLRRDRHDRLRFAAAESVDLATLIKRHQIGPTDSLTVPSTILVVKHLGGADEQLLVRSSAALSMLCELPRPWPAIAAVLRLIPRPVRDLGYRLIARFRHRIGGRLKRCPLPTVEKRERFL